MIVHASHSTRIHGQRKVANIVALGCLFAVASAIAAQDGRMNGPASGDPGTNAMVHIDSSGSVRTAADHRSIKELTAALKNDDRATRTEAIAALGQTGNAHAVKPLIASLKDRDPYVRAYAGMALIHIGNPAIEPLISAMKDNDLYVSALSALALSSMKDSRAHNALMTALQEHNSRAIFGTHTFFVKLGMPGSESALIESLNKFPSQEMAEEFFNSGNPALASAANEWAQKYKHPLKLTTATVHWGSGPGAPIETASNPLPAAR